MADRLRFYMDEHVPKAVAEGLRRRGVDVVTVQEIGLQAADDQRHLERAAQEGRVVVTQDADLLRLTQPVSLIEALCMRLSRRRWLTC